MTDEWINKTCYIYTMNHSVIKKKKKKDAICSNVDATRDDRTK